MKQFNNLPNLKNNIIMMQFKSDVSNDFIKITYILNSNESNLFVKEFDNFDENLKLIHKVTETLSKKNILWIICNVHNKPIIKNISYHKNNKANQIMCKIEDFEKFYIKNLDKIISLSNISIPLNETDNGWTTVIDSKKLKIKKFNEIKKKIAEISINWNKL